MKRFTYIILYIYALIVVLPFLWVISTSFKSSQEIFSNPFSLPRLLGGSAKCDRTQCNNASLIRSGGQPVKVRCEKETVQALDHKFSIYCGREHSFIEYQCPVCKKAYLLLSGWDSVKHNYAVAWVKSNFKYYFAGSLKVTIISLVLILTLSTMASYAIARYPFRINNFYFYYFLAGLMVPAQLLIVPLFFQYTAISSTVNSLMHAVGLTRYQFQLHDSHTGLILIYTAIAMPFTILILTSFFKTLPSSLYEAAIIDGCSEWQAFRQVMLPLARPGLITVAIFNFIGIWNEFLFALVFINNEKLKTLPLGLASVSMQASYKTDYGMLFAGLVIIMIPTLIIYLIMQKRLTKGITLGALKG